MGQQQLITDLFEKITLYDVAAVKATSKKRADGRYAVHLVVRARKVQADGHGRQHDVPFANERFDLGLFRAEPGKGSFRASDVLHFARTPVHAGMQTFDLVVDHEPSFAGIDPYNKYIDRNSDDNVIAVGR